MQQHSDLSERWGELDYKTPKKNILKNSYSKKLWISFFSNLFLPIFFPLKIFKNVCEKNYVRRLHLPDLPHGGSTNWPSPFWIVPSRPDDYREVLVSVSETGIYFYPICIRLKKIIDIFFLKKFKFTETKSEKVIAF